MTTTQSKVKNALKSTKEKKPKSKMTNKDYVNSMLPAIAKAVPEKIMSADQFSRMMLTALSKDKKLMECTPESFMAAMMTAAQLGLEPNTETGQAYLIPYRNKGKLECQFQLGYRGQLQLAFRSGQIKSIECHTVYENDHFEFRYGLNPKLDHIPAMHDRGDVKCFYAKVETTSGGYIFEVMSKEAIDAHAKKFSQSYGSNYSPWKTNYEMMALKTVLKRVLKYAPLSTNLIREISTDETIKNVTEEEIRESQVDVIDLPNEFDFEVEPEEVMTENEEFEPVQQSIDA